MRMHPLSAAMSFLSFNFCLLTLVRMLFVFTILLFGSLRFCFSSILCIGSAFEIKTRTHMFTLTHTHECTRTPMQLENRKHFGFCGNCSQSYAAHTEFSLFRNVDRNRRAFRAHPFRRSIVQFSVCYLYISLCHCVLFWTRNQKAARKRLKC